MAGSLAQFIETAAFGVLNDVLSGFHSQNGYAVPNRFEAVIIPPTGIGRNSSSTFLFFASVSTASSGASSSDLLRVRVDIFRKIIDR